MNKQTESAGRLRFSILNIFLLTTIAGLTIALIAEYRQSPAVFYVHLYSNRYDIASMGDELPGKWECIATVSVVSASPFFADIPCHNEPQMFLQGIVEFRGDEVSADFKIIVSDPGPTYLHHQTTPVVIDENVSFGDGEFQFVVSTLPDGSEFIPE